MATRNFLYLHARVQAPPAFHEPPPPPTSSSSDTSFPILVISTLGMITTAVLLVSYYVFVIKCCTNWRRSDVISRLSGSRNSRRPRWLETGSSTAFVSGRKHGLEEAVIRSIPVFQFKKGNGGGGGGGMDGAEVGSFHECVVCLNEFVDGERLRLLPGCSHAFHIDCIDVWLQGSANCPLCRSDVTGGSVLRASQLLRTVPQCGFLVIEVTEDGNDDSGTANDLTPQQQHQSPAPPDALRLLSPTKAEQRTEQNKRRGSFLHVRSMGDECVEVGRMKDEVSFSVQPMRRSFSMDSSCSRQLYLSAQAMTLPQSDPRRRPVDGVVSTEEEDSSVALAAGRGSRRSFFSFGRSPRRVAAILPMDA